MFSRRLCAAAKQRPNPSSSAPTPLFHTQNRALTPQQAAHCVYAIRLLWTQEKAPFSRADGTHLDNSTDIPPKKSSFRARRAQRASEEEEKKKKKKRGPPGPVPFESLTAPKALHSDLPFAFRHSYTEIPKVPPVGFQEKFSPFGPGRVDRAWDGQQAVPLSAPSSSSSSLSSTNPVSSSLAYPENINKSKYSFKGIKLINPPSPILSRTHTRRVRTREEILGEPITAEEVKELVEHASRSQTRRQINMGRDGLTHNMLIEAHDHWKREPVVRIKCKGVPTVDMDNVLFQLEDKTGGKIIQRAGGTVYLFRGRNYSYKDRPIIPPMLWKPHAPLYPKLITEAPGGLKVHEANFLRKRGLRIMRLCILSKNGYYGDLVRHVREAFEDDDLVRIDCKGLNISDYKKIGAKLRDLVPCYLLSFDKEQIVLWKGKDTNLSSTSSTKSSNSEEAEGENVHVVKDTDEDIAAVHNSGEDDVSEDRGIRQSVAHIGDTSDEDTECATILTKSVEAGDADESSDTGSSTCEEDEACGANF